MLRRLVLSVVIVALAGCSSAGDRVGGDDARSARVGETVPAVLTQDIEGRHSAITLPDRRYDLLVTTPRDRIDTVSAGEAGIDDRAAGGTRFVGLTWDLAPSGGDAMALAGQGDPVPAEAALLVDGDPVDLGPLDSEVAPGWWVVVPEDARTIGVAITYDGLTQTIEDATGQQGQPAGAPELLSSLDSAGLHDPDCPEPAQGPEPSRYAFASCTVTISDPIPYHRALGWSVFGQGWIVVRLSVQPVAAGWDDPGPGGAVVDYETREGDEVTVTLDGDEPVELLPVEPDQPVGLQEDGWWKADAVFLVPDDTTAFEVAFARPYTAVPEDPDEAVAEGTPAELTGTYAATFEVDV